MIKFAQFRSLWPTIYRHLKSPPPGITLGDFPSKLPPMEKIILEQSGPPEKTSAAAYVTTEDVNHDGRIDKIHLVVPHFDRHLQGLTMADFEGKDLDRLASILKGLVETLAHEIGHIGDYKPNQDQPFPGGEGIAEQKGREAASQIKVTSGNKNKENRRLAMNKEIILRLVKLAGDLDAKGAYAFADQITKVAQAGVVGHTEIQGLEKNLKEKLGPYYKGEDSPWIGYYINNFLDDDGDQEAKINKWVNIVRNWVRIYGPSGKNNFTGWVNHPSYKEAAQKLDKAWPTGFSLDEIPEFARKYSRVENVESLSGPKPRLQPGAVEPFTPKEYTIEQMSRTQMASPSMIPKTWDQYIFTGPKSNEATRKKISQIWSALTDIAPEQLPGYNEAFASFVKWYNDNGFPTVEEAYEVLFAIFKRENMPASQADDAMCASDSIFEADSMDDVVKSANINSLFWNGASKTPFGR